MGNKRKRLKEQKHQQKSALPAGMKKISEEYRAQYLPHRIMLLSYIAQPVTALLHGTQETQGKSDLNSLGLGVALIGVYITLKNQLYLKKHIETGPLGTIKDTLAKEGPYQLIRNPIYASIRASSLGWMMYNSSLLALALSTATFASSEYLVRAEERRCAKDFGDEYLQYKERVPRWIPQSETIEDGMRHFSIAHPALTELVNKLAPIFS